MAKKGIPDPLERRHLVERELAPEHAEGLADAYLEAGRREEAVVFLGKAGASERLEALWEEAVDSGSVFLLRAVAEQLGRDPEPAVWERLAESARAAGLDVYAETALRQAHRSED